MNVVHIVKLGGLQPYFLILLTWLVLLVVWQALHALLDLIAHWRRDLLGEEE